MIVVDVGCATHGHHDSIGRLIAEHNPDLLYGFDPAWEGDLQFIWGGCTVVVSKSAAWTREGGVGFTIAGLGGHVDESKPAVDCMNLAAFIGRLPADHHVVLKLDAEGSEYELLEHLIDSGADRRLLLTLVEWHPDPYDPDGVRRANIEERIACELQEWPW